MGRTDDSPEMGRSGRLMLSVVVPAYMEGSKIALNVNKFTDALERIGTDYEVIVVSDGSTDDTYNQALNAARQHVKVLGYTPNMGKGIALRYGFRHSTSDPDTF